MADDNIVSSVLLKVVKVDNQNQANRQEIDILSDDDDDEDELILPAVIFVKIDAILFIDNLKLFSAQRQIKGKNEKLLSVLCSSENFGIGRRHSKVLIST